MIPKTISKLTDLYQLSYRALPFKLCSCSLGSLCFHAPARCLPSSLDQYLLSIYASLLYTVQMETSQYIVNKIET